MNSCAVRENSLKLPLKISIFKRKTGREIWKIKLPRAYQFFNIGVYKLIRDERNCSPILASIPTMNILCKNRQKNPKRKKLNVLEQCCGSAFISMRIRFLVRLPSHKKLDFYMKI
jgi:hypothetical protein